MEYFRAMSAGHGRVDGVGPLYFFLITRPPPACYTSITLLKNMSYANYMVLLFPETWKKRESESVHMPGAELVSQPIHRIPDFLRNCYPLTI